VNEMAGDVQMEELVRKCGQWPHLKRQFWRLENYIGTVNFGWRVNVCV